MAFWDRIKPRSPANVILSRWRGHIVPHKPLTLFEAGHIVEVVADPQDLPAFASAELHVNLSTGNLPVQTIGILRITTDSSRLLRPLQNSLSTPKRSGDLEHLLPDVDIPVYVVLDNERGLDLLIRNML